MSGKKHIYVKTGNKFGNIINDDLDRMLDDLNDKFYQKILDIHKNLVNGNMTRRDFEKEMAKINNEISMYILNKYGNLLKFMRDEELTIGFEIDFEEIDLLKDALSDSTTIESFDIGNCKLNKFDFENF